MGGMPANSQGAEDGVLQRTKRQLGRRWDTVCRGDLERTVRELTEGQALGVMGYEVGTRAGEGKERG